MNDYRERLESTGMMPAFERARKATDSMAMRQILERSGFKLLEIEPILRAKGEIGPPLTAQDRRKRFWDAVTARIATALVSGLILGGLFVYGSSGLASAERSDRRPDDVVMADFRSPREAYYKPFGIGFSIGVIWSAYHRSTRV